MTQRRIIQDEYPYFVTFRTREGFGLFEEEQYAELMATIMFNAGRMKHVDILGYQIMPDHAHVLIHTNRARVSPPALSIHMEGRAPAERRAWGNNNLPPAGLRARGGHTISEFVYTVKSYFVHRMRTRYGINFPIFQKRFYTCIVDTDQYLRTVVSYIKNNPIKAGLPHRYTRTPYHYIDMKNKQIIIKDVKRGCRS